MLERRLNEVPDVVPLIDINHSACSISNHGDYLRVASISFRACSGAATCVLFKSGVYSRVASIQSYMVFVSS